MSNPSYDQHRQGYNRDYYNDRDEPRQHRQYHDEQSGQFGEGSHYGQSSPDYREGTARRDFDERGYGRSDPFYGDRDNNRSQSRGEHSGRDDVMNARAYGGGQSGRRGYGSAVNTGPQQRGYDDDYSYGTGYRGDGYRDNSNYNRDSASRYNDDRNDRGFFDKAGDEIASWFGDEDAERRRRRDHRGRGPANYTRSDERLLEDACERLTHSSHVDASGIHVTAKDNEIMLDGSIDSRYEKRAAEDCVHDISGVKHVQNNLRIADRDDLSAEETGGDRKSGTKNRKPTTKR